MAESKLDIQQSILEVAYTPQLDPSILDVQQSIIEMAYIPVLDPSTLNIQQSIIELAYTPILEASVLQNQQSIIEIAYTPNKIYDQPLTPITDIHNSGSWSGSPIYSNIISTGTGEGYVLSPVTPSNASFEVQFPQITNYNSGNNIVIQSYFYKVDSNLSPTGNGDTIDIVIDLMLSGSVLESFNYLDVKNISLEYFLPSGITRSQIQDNDILSIRVTANTSSIDVSNPRYILMDYLALGIDADITEPIPIPLILIKANTIISGKGKTIIKVPG